MTMKIRALSKPLQEKAEKELNENPNHLEEYLGILKKWLIQQEHLKYKDDDQLLVNFLRACKFSIQRAKEKVDAYYTLRTIAPEFSPIYDPLSPNMQRILNLGTVIPLDIPKDDPASPLVALIRYTDFDPEEVNITLLTKGFMLHFEVLFNDNDNFVISGAKVIWDLKGLQFKTATQITASLVKKLIYACEKAYPIRLKAIYIVNMPTFFESIFNFGKRLISKKLANRIYFCSTAGSKNICNHIPKAILPSEYGGEAGPLNDLAVKWKQTVESCRGRILREIEYYSDESKRPGIPNTVETLFGVDGTFKKLEID